MSKDEQNTANGPVIPDKVLSSAEVDSLNEKRAGLTWMQWLFVNEYAVDFNGKAAAIRAGYAESTAHVQASKLLQKETVQRALATVLQDRTERVKITQDMVLQEYGRIAFSSIGDICSWEDSGLVTVKSSDEIPDHALAAISEISRVPTETGMAIKVRMHDKLTALKDVAKHLGMFQQQKKGDDDAGKYAKLTAGQLAKIVSFEQRREAKLIEHKEEASGD